MKCGILDPKKEELVDPNINHGLIYSTAPMLISQFDHYTTITQVINISRNWVKGTWKLYYF